MIERALSGGAAALVRKSIAPAEPNSAAAEPFAGPTGSRSTTAATISAAASGSITDEGGVVPEPLPSRLERNSAEIHLMQAFVRKPCK